MTGFSRTELNIEILLINNVLITVCVNTALITNLIRYFIVGIHVFIKIFCNFTLQIKKKLKIMY